MEYKGQNLCDFCFEPIDVNANFCSQCGLNHEKYHAEAGLLLPGANLMGKYIIGRALGRGGFGATYLAYSSDREKVVAIKEYYPTGIACRGKGEEVISIVSEDKREVFEKGVTRFFEEAKTISKFNSNNNVVSVYEFFYTNKTAYYSMEYLRGIDLKGYISKKGGRLNENEALTVMKGVCDALVAVHSTQTLHRDISPDNIFICTNGDVKLIDFGAAKQVVGEYVQQNYSVVVKQGFAPPEQYKSSGNQGVWTDIYAVGATIYYALTGEVPMDAVNRAENPEIVFDTSLNVSDEFAEIINKCLSLKIDERYQSAIELLAAIKSMTVASSSVGGNEYVQAVYNGSVESDVYGKGLIFNDFTGIKASNSNPSGYVPKSQQLTEANNYSQYPNSQYPNSQYPNSQYPFSQYPNSQYYDVEKRVRNAMLKGILIGASALLIVVLLVILVTELISQQKQVDNYDSYPYSYSYSYYD